MYEKATAKIGRFRSDQGGYAALTFAILAVPLVGLVGMSVDAGIAYRHKSELQQAVDIASLHIARRSIRDTVVTEEELIAQGKQIISANVDFPVSFRDFTVDADYAKVKVKLSAVYDTTFAKLIAVTKFDIAVESTATYERDKVDFFVLVDNTPSMLLGATQKDVDSMREQMNCEFACHEGRPGDTYSQARSMGVTLRFDAIGQALEALTQRLDEITLPNTEYKVGIYHFGLKDSAPALTKHLELNKSMGSVRSAASTLPPMLGTNLRSTDFITQLTAMRTELRDKQSLSDPRNQVLVIVTDGLHDSRRNAPNSNYDGTGYIAPISIAQCTALKDDGVKIAILYTPYFQVTHEWWNISAWYPKDMANLIPSTLKACASPGLYNTVDFEDPTSYAREMEILVSMSAQSLRLTSN